MFADGFRARGFAASWNDGRERQKNPGIAAGVLHLIFA
jgi:hypothetical protein